MDADTILKTFEPVLADASARLLKRTKADSSDVQRIFTPVFESIARAAGGGHSVIDRLSSWGPADVTQGTLRALVQDIVAAATPAVDIAAMQRHQEALEAEMARIVRPDRPEIGY
jgi:hypothetical protein